tara:strand:- start:424 stop:657 length:234 start_codon:yes stop_codon:yes gene_type:complete
MPKEKVICNVCKGNGFVKVPYEQTYDEQWADCDFCNNQGEIYLEDEYINEQFDHDLNEVEEDTDDRGSGTSGSHTTH